MRALAALFILSAMPYPLRAQQQDFLSPGHDLRFAIALELPKHEIAAFYNLTYGDTIRLKESPYYCGDPLFLVRVDESPSLKMSGYLSPQGDYGTAVAFRGHFNAKIWETCFGFDRPNAGGAVILTSQVGAVSAVDHLELKGKAQSDPLPPGGWTFDFPFPNVSVPLPYHPLNSLPIDLSRLQKVGLDFGQLTAGKWTTSGTHKDIPLLLNVGSFGNPTDDSPFLIVDAIIGSQPRKNNFSDAASAHADFESDLPIWGPGNIGISLKQSFFGAANPQQVRSGLLGSLLPVRVLGEAQFRTLCIFKKCLIHGTKEYEVILDIARSTFEAAPALATPNKETRPAQIFYPAMDVTLGTTHAIVRKVKYKDGKRIVGKDKFVKRVLAKALFDRFQVDPSQGFRFRVADFKVLVKTRWFVIPIRLSSGGLEQTLNGGTVPIANLKQEFGYSVPECVDTKWDKMKARRGSCNDPGQKIGWLSYEWGKPSTLLTLDLGSLQTRTVTKAVTAAPGGKPSQAIDALQLGFQFVAH